MGKEKTTRASHIGHHHNLYFKILLEQYLLRYIVENIKSGKVNSQIPPPRIPE